MYDPIEKSFFSLPTIQLAQKLLGHYLVHNLSSQLLVGRIVETEAYKGPDDRAAHSFNNLRTKRTEIMFGEPGFAYTHQMHTHTLINIVSGPVGVPHAVLIRAVEPVVGLDKMRANRGKKFKDVDLTNGPGKLAKALEITMDYYGHDLSEQPLFISEGVPMGDIEASPRVGDIIAGPRVGIPNTGEARDYPWRFFEKNNPFVSKFR